MSGSLGFATPGYTATRSTVEADLSWGGEYGRQLRYKSVALSSSTVDAGNSPATVLRPGLILGEIAASGLWIQYSPSATDGSEVAKGVLGIEMNMLDPVTATAGAKFIPVIVGGPLKGNRLKVASGGIDALARSQLHAQGFWFDDDFPANPAMPWYREVNKSTDYTVVAADTGKLFTASGAANFTLPTLAPGLRFRFFNLADNTMVITSAAGNDIIVDGDIAASSITFSTSSHKVGAHAEIVSNAAGTKWYAAILSGPGVVATIA